MALAKNKHGFDVVVDFGEGPRTVKDGELVKVPDEYFRHHVIPEATWEVRNKPEFAALSIEEERERDAQEAVDEPESTDDTEARQEADRAAADELAAEWDNAAESPPAEHAPVDEPASQEGEPV